MANGPMRGIAGEYAGASLGDQRRSTRLIAVAEKLEREPSLGFPRAIGSQSELEAFYRFINNDGFTAEAALAPHRAATLSRARESKEVIVVHDTTLVEFSTPRDGLGVTTRGRQGFVAHVSLVIADKVPLGVAHVETLTRSGTKRRSGKSSHRRVREDSGRESLRWLRGVESIESVRGQQFSAVHITDAEGDFFELLASIHTASARFIIRAGQLDRIVHAEGDESSLRECIQRIGVGATRTIELSERKHPARTVARSKLRRHPERVARSAKVAIGATSVMLKKTHYSDTPCEPFSVNVVRVWEIDPVEGQPSVEWVLLTNEDVSSKSALERIVDLYRERWMIEDYFKALKTGCALEKRQVESYDALCKVLALFIPIAYRLLLLRGLERAQPTAPAETGFTATELHIMSKAPSNQGMKPAVTMQHALLHLARLGGHLRNNGPPGWQTLGRGYEKLLTLKLGWEMAIASLEERSDQS
jgi:hypothetical protein